MEGKVFISGGSTSDLPRLSERESAELLKKLTAGDNAARERFIVANFRLVLAVAKRFRLKTGSYDDVFQAGVIGLIKAIDRVDLSYGVRFSTYAVPMIIGEIKRVIKGANSLRIPRSVRDTAYHALRARSEIEKRHEEPTLELIAKELNVAVSDVSFALDAISDTVSLYDPVYSKNGDELLLVDSISDEKNTEENWMESVALDNALKTLSERERKIILLRYFEGKTQTEISAEVGISQAQVSRLEKSALKDIKQKIQA